MDGELIYEMLSTDMSPRILDDSEILGAYFLLLATPDQGVE